MSSADRPATAPKQTAALEADVVLVVPCYNEAARLDLAAFRGYETARRRIGFCFVNDGSHDRTLEVLQGLVREMPGRAVVLDLPRNGGKAEAVRQGMLAALGWGASAVGFWDADLASPLAELARFCDVLDERPQVELVIGSRVRLLGRRIERSAVRHYLGRIFATGASLTLGLPVYDTQCGAKLLRATPLTRELFATPFLTRWVFDVELLARYRRLVSEQPPPLEQRLYELPLAQWTDVAGSKVRPWDFVRSGLELVRIWRAYRKRPAA
jgi:dolichyl-phosphate beta-glucosyltransferase